MNITWAPGVRESLLSWARDEAPREACGLLFGDRSPSRLHLTRAERVANRHPRPERAFRLCPDALLAHGADPELLAVWHSHPRGPEELSESDRAGASAWPRLLQVLVVNGRVLVCPTAGGTAPVW